MQTMQACALCMCVRTHYTSVRLYGLHPRACVCTLCSCTVQVQARAGQILAIAYRRYRSISAIDIDILLQSTRMRWKSDFRIRCTMHMHVCFFFFFFCFPSTGHLLNNSFAITNHSEYTFFQIYIRYNKDKYDIDIIKELQQFIMNCQKDL